MRRISAVTYLLLITFITATVCFANDSNVGIHTDIHEFHLENGMQFLIVERHAAPQIACRVAIRAGSALEDTGKTGIAHMLEHMMFKGTKNFGTLDVEQDQELQQRIEAAYQDILEEKKKRRPNRFLIQKRQAEMAALRLEVQKIFVPLAFSAQLGKNGAVGINAFTSQDQTQYMMSIPSDMIELWFSMVSEQLFEPSWREFYVEKEVIQREWAYRYVNNPNGAAWMDLYATAFSAHPYRNPIIGWQSDIEKFNTRDAMEFHQTHYNPTNAVCVLVGDITPDSAKQLAQTYFGRYPAGGRSPEVVTQDPPQEHLRKSIRYLKGARTPLVRIGFHAAPMGTHDFFALDALTMVLSQGRGARMVQNIVQKGLAADAWAYNPDHRYAGMVILGGTPDEPESLKKKGSNEEQVRQAYITACESLEQAILGEVERMKHEPVSERELERIKKLSQRNFLNRMRRNEDLAATLATLEVQIGWEYLLEYVKQISRITSEDIRRVAQKYFRTDNQTSVYVIPGGTPDRPTEEYMEIRSPGGSTTGNVILPNAFENHSRHPTPAGWKHPLSFERKPHKISYPRADKMSIGNTTMFYLHDDQLPLVDLTLLFKAGAVDIDEEKTGLAEVLEKLLVQGGTQTRSPSELALYLDEHAIQISISVREEETQIHLSVMKEDWPKGLNILAEILTRPRFDTRLLEVVKNQQITALERQNENAQAVAMREGKIWQFQGHPYGYDPLKGIQTIPHIRQSDLNAFVKGYFIPSNMVATLSGNIDKDTVEASMKTFLQFFSEGTAQNRHIKAPVSAPPTLTLIHKPGQVQSQISLRLDSVRRTHPDYWKINLLMNLFGGTDSLLHKRLRDDLGFVYSAWFHQSYKWHAGFLLGYIGCKSDQTRAALQETVHIMEYLRHDIPEKELELKRLDALNGFIFNVNSPFELVKVYGRYHLLEEPLDTLERIQDIYISVSLEEIQKLAAALLDPNNLQIFIVADKNTRIKTPNGVVWTLEEDVKHLAKKLGLPFQEKNLD